MSKAIEDVVTERNRQVVEEGYGSAHDDEHVGDLANAGAAYAANAGDHLQGFTESTAYRELWPWDSKYWKPKNPRRDLVRAAALIIAEIERIDRSAHE
jgi:hypothetical protein